MLPEGWTYRPISKIGRIITGSTPPTGNAELYGGATPFVAPGDLGRSKFIDSAEKTITQKGLDGSRSVPAGSTLFTCIGSTIGKMGLASVAVTTNQQINSVVPHPGHDPEFVYYQLLHHAKRIKRLAGTQAVPLITKSQFALEKLAIPPTKAEEARIAKMLSTWDRAIATVEKLIANARAQKQALTHQLITGEKRLSGFSGRWPERTLGSLGETYGGLAGKTKADFGVGQAYVPYKNVFENSIVDMSNLDRVMIGKGERQNTVRFGDVLFTTSSETPEEVGMSSVVLSNSESAYLNSFCFGFRPNSLIELQPEFAAHFFRCTQMRGLISALAQGSTRYNISKRALLKLSFQLPPPKEQTALAELMDVAQSNMSGLELQANSLRQEKSALMQQLLTGKRRVKIETQVPPLREAAA